MAKLRKTNKAYDKAYYLAHKKEVAAKNKAYRLVHKKEIKEYCLTHKEEISARSKSWYLANTERAKTNSRAHYLAHKKEIAERQRANHRKYPEKRKAKYRRQMALRRNVHHEPYTDNYVFERDSWKCGICGRKINKRLKYPNPLSPSIDHIIPLRKGGNDSPINVQAAHLRCNMIKQAQRGGQLRLIG